MKNVSSTSTTSSWCTWTSSLAIEDDVTSDDDSGGHVDYKIGDLGHVAHVSKDKNSINAEEGDCRYMAPEFLQDLQIKIDYYKADIFSLGLTLFEAASLMSLPRNSYDNELLYGELKQGKLPYLPHYSLKLNRLMSSMVNPNIQERPDTSTLLADINPKCSILLEWGDHSGAHRPVKATDSSDNTSEDTSLEEESSVSLVNSELELLKAKEKILSLEQELRNKDAQMAKVKDYIMSRDSNLIESNSHIDLSNFSEKVTKIRSP